MVSVDLYGHEGFAYLVLDPARKGKEMNALLVKEIEIGKETETIIDEVRFNRCGVMILVSSKKIEPQEVVSCYYMRQAVEQVFGFCKDDLSLLPIRRHNESTIRGYLFMQFLTLIFGLSHRFARG
jgi:transposase